MEKLEDQILERNFYSASQLEPYQMFEIVHKMGKEKHSRPVQLGK